MNVNNIKVLLACEESGECRRAFRKIGFDAWSCDIIPASDNSDYHIQDDIFNVLNNKQEWHCMIAFWPCTRLCNSGVRWLHERNLWTEMEQSALKFKYLLEFNNIPLRGMENPIPHKYALDIIGSKYDQIIHPWQFGHGETKSTCLWLRGLPKLTPTNITNDRQHRIHRLPPSSDRSKIRSRTYPGIAKAMADQWGKAIVERYR
ncbi:MAG: hypothetical protein BAJALOKI3v1_50062 [Promethearchaeota archaeon]|nr:MAG: hypothetical protein BAJALOKI3v1_50062 [Candidatus Lokiarchaeota archaeon]